MPMFSKKVLCLNTDGKVFEFGSATEASETLSIPLTGVRDCLRGAQSTSKGFKFVYGTMDEYENGSVVFPEAKNNIRDKGNVPVILFNPDTTVHGFYKSNREAAKAINSQPSAVNVCVAGKSYMVKGFIVVPGTKEDYEQGRVKYTVPKKHGKNFPVVQVSFGGMEIAVYKSINDAAKADKSFDRSGISKCANHLTHSAYGYVWMYLDEWILADKKLVESAKKHKNNTEEQIKNSF